MTKMLKLLLPLALLGLGIFIYLGNTRITSRLIVVRDKNLPKSFRDFKIAHISDLHNRNWEGSLEELLEGEKPDAIFITGDLVDSRNPDLRLTHTYLKNFLAIAPSYYVTGNHEHRMSELDTILEGFRDLGLQVLDNRLVEIKRGDDIIHIAGVSDISSVKRISPNENNDSKMSRVLLDLLGSRTDYTILLSHRPELFGVYESFGINLTLAGHAHGGQVVIPLVGPLFAPNQGFFPKFTDGLYEGEDSKLIVSRGLGNSSFPLRFNNSPDLIFIQLTD